MSGIELNKLRRLVIKIGSSLLVNQDGRLDRDWLSGLAEDIATLNAASQQLLIVSSGAIAIGSNVLGINPRRARLEELQAAAAAGQVQLVYAFQEALGVHGIAAAQVLLTLYDTENRRRFLNAKGTASILSIVKRQQYLSGSDAVLAKCFLIRVNELNLPCGSRC